MAFFFCNDLLTTNFELDINCFTQQSPVCVTPVLQSLLLTFCTRNSTRILLRLPHYQILFLLFVYYSLRPNISHYNLTFTMYMFAPFRFLFCFTSFCLCRTIGFLLCSNVCFFLSLTRLMNVTSFLQQVRDSLL